MEKSFAHEQYDQHVKESLLSGKPVVYSLKDFMPKKEIKKRAKTQKPKEEIQVTIEELTNYIQYMYNIFNEHQIDMANKGKFKEATKAWEQKSIYETLLCKIYKREYVCNIPSYATWR